MRHIEKAKTKGNWLDQAIGFFSPRRGYERAMWRMAGSAYDAAGIGRPNGNWRPVSGPAELGMKTARSLLRDRARDMENNSDFVATLLGAFERNVVGTGIRPQARVVVDSEQSADTNQAIEALWKEWSRKENCDLEGNQSFEEMQRLVLRRTLVDGGIFALFVDNPQSNLNFSIQFREIDELDETKNSMAGESGHFMYSGIEFDANRRPVRYFFKRFQPDGTWMGETDEVMADRVLYIWDKTRPSQVREVSPLARALERIRDLNEYMTAVAVKERVAACFSAAIIRNSPDTNMPGRNGKATTQAGAKEETLSPGLIMHLQPGEDIKPVAPVAQSSDAEAYIRIQQRIIGAGMGISYEAASRDMSQVNYSSARQGLLEDQRTYGLWQQFLIDHFCQAVYGEFIAYAYLSGKVMMKHYVGQPQAYARHEWATPGWSWIDPYKEANANKLALESNQETMQKIYADQGRDWREALQQRARELQYMRELGLIDLQGGQGNGETAQEQGRTPKG